MNQLLQPLLHGPCIVKGQNWLSLSLYMRTATMGMVLNLIPCVLYLCRNAHCGPPHCIWCNTKGKKYTLTNGPTPTIRNPYIAERFFNGRLFIMVALYTKYNSRPNTLCTSSRHQMWPTERGVLFFFSTTTTTATYTTTTEGTSFQ